MFSTLTGAGRSLWRAQASSLEWIGFRPMAEAWLSRIAGVIASLIFDVTPYDPAVTSEPAPRLRAAFSGCPGASDAVILPDSSKAFVACSGGHQVMAVGLAAAPGSWAAKQNPALMTDHLLTFLDVGKTPVHLAMKPDGGEIFVSNSWVGQHLGDFYLDE